MNKFRFIKLVVLLICLFCLNTYGQRQQISKANFDEAYRNADENTKKISYRLVTEVQKYIKNESNLFSTSKGLYEFIPPYKTRIVWEEKIAATNEASLIETIIAEDVYERKNNQEWIKKLPEPVSIQLPLQQSFPTLRYYLTKDVELDNKKANLYEIQYEIEFITQKPKKDKGKREKFYRNEKYWVSTAGLWLKKEFKNKEFLYDSFLRNSISIYSYDANVEIETPIVKSELKTSN